MLFSTIECYLLKFIKTTSHFRDLCHKNGYIKHKNSKKTATTILNNVIAVECFIFCFQTYLILSAALTRRSSDMIPLYAMNTKAMAKAGSPPPNSIWKLVPEAASPRTLPYTAYTIYHPIRRKILNMHILACTRRL